ncbi:chromosome partitioning protein ParB [Aureimonas ureilytica]|uniref:Chromosome partitioning protein ParB n=1 Tax=Aureimonas ureilytica TaxID=401562 RepID=A0A175RK01_9HYPH|nr:plasmid partitioning protein RepB [Aureimonas ureilytica]KTR03976.1 chromosome partitioning protein ParB [Aureimonas ureilytica]
MNKRSKSIASIFATRPDAAPLSSDNEARLPRVSSGSVRSMKESFSQIERENETLRQSLSEGARIVEIDPFLIDPSPYADRYPDDENAESFEALVTSMAENGQEVPVLLRTHPLDASRFQTAFGHRRVRAARTLNRPVRAIVREMDDEALALAQGIENSARQDLTFIERAVFATRLEEAGQSRAVIGRALSVDKAEVSKLIAVARSVPEPMLRQIGRAPKVGRTRWQALVEALNGEGAIQRVQRLLFDQLPGLSSDERFAAVLEAAKRRPTPAPVERSIIAHSGRRLAQLSAKERDTKLVIDRDLGLDFADFIARHLPDLFDTYERERGNSENPADAGPSEDRS